MIIKIKKVLQLFSLSLSLSVLPMLCLSAQETVISREQVVADLTFLASDQLNGRANFSPGIEQAADYLSTRFETMGLSHLQGLDSFKQTFTISKITPGSISVTLNGKTIGADNLAMASTIREISWQHNTDFNTQVISATDNLREAISKLNQQGGKHLVLLNNAHAALFSRYKNYFKRGTSKLNLNHQGAIIIVLTDETMVSSIDIKASISIENNSLTNVVALLPGKTRPQEIVLYSAHYDHLGAKSEGEGDLIFNGADDDASGTTAVINLAEYFASKGGNNRTLMFIAFAGEEMGGFGSRYFAGKLDPNNIIAMINIEMIGKVSKFGKGTLWMTGMERSDLGDLLNSELKAKNIEIYQDPYPKQGLFYRSDNATLARLGVPAHSFSSTQLDKDQHYHQVSDEVKTLNLDSMVQVIETLAIATQGLVDARNTPSRLDISKINSRGKIY